MDYIKCATSLTEFIIDREDQEKLQWAIGTLEHSLSVTKRVIAKHVIREYVDLSLYVLNPDEITQQQPL